MITLFIGRFQPFHNGHLKDVKDILETTDKLKIAIGSSTESNTMENPFSFDERVEMILKCLKKEKIEDYEIYSVPDINDDEKWVEHVQNIVGKFDLVVSGNKHVQKLFLEKNVLVNDVGFLEGVNGTDIREDIINHKEWYQKVPDPVYLYLKEIEGAMRIRQINKLSKNS